MALLLLSLVGVSDMHLVAEWAPPLPLWAVWSRNVCDWTMFRMVLFRP